MKPARLKWIDYARGIAIIMVVYRHVYEGAKQSGLDFSEYKFQEYINILFYSFRMPLFFIISGIFISYNVQKKGVKQYVSTRARTVLYPYFLWGSIQLLLQIAFANYTNGEAQFSSFAYLFYLPRELAQFWYLYALFNVSMLYLLTKFVLKISAVLNLILGLILYYVSAYLFREQVSLGFVFDIMHYYLFFVIGDMIGALVKTEKFQKVVSSGSLLIGLSGLFFALQTYFLIANLRNDVAKYMFVEFFQPTIYLFIALVGCTYIVVLTSWLEKRKIGKWLPLLGKYSLYIYVAHVIVFAGARVFVMKVFGINHPLIIIFSGIVLGLIVPILLYKLAIKLNMPWVFSLEKRKETVRPV